MNNLRPIGLQNILCKLTHSITAGRLQNDFKRNKALHKGNVGSLAGLGPQHAIHAVLHAWAHAKRTKKGCFTTFYDVTGAYDHLPWEAILHGMQQIHLPQNYISFIMGTLKGTSATIRSAFGLTDPFSLTRGTIQGNPSSCLLFVIALNALHVGLEQDFDTNVKHGYSFMEQKYDREQY